MDAKDAAEQLREAKENERFDNIAALIISVMAMLLAITSVGGSNAVEDMLTSQIEASDTWNFYQAKNIRQTMYRVFAEEIDERLKLGDGGINVTQRQTLEKRLNDYRSTVTRYESEPDPQDPTNPIKGEGKKELTARARYLEGERDKARERDNNFDYAEALFQIAIVLGSVSIVANKRPLLWLSAGMGLVATLLMLNGFFLVVKLPF
ncbi:MAG: DUF4337 domain-containing protein [Chloroflexi bacterium]|nr:DUF4337 domain-containing protein [Chloroflexota bacterium]